MSEESDNVIHVRFGKDGAERVPPPPPPAPVAPEPVHISQKRFEHDPLAGLYTLAEVARLFAFTEGRLRHWDRIGFIQPSGRAKQRRYYTFQDLLGVRVAKGLMDQGVPLNRVRRSVEALKGALPKVTRPLSELSVQADGSTVVVRGEDGAFEPETGQLVLNFEVRDLKDDVVRVLRTSSPDKRRLAYEAYLEGCRLDEDEGTSVEAEAAYRRAIELDPALATAITNLGNLCFRRGETAQAKALYEQALAVDADQPEALYNLGFLHFERGDIERAARSFAQALKSDPSFADAHFNLAMAYEELGRQHEARPHWQAYVRLDPAGPWADIARRHLQ